MKKYLVVLFLTILFSNYMLTDSEAQDSVHNHNNNGIPGTSTENPEELKPTPEDCSRAFPNALEDFYQYNSRADHLFFSLKASNENLIEETKTDKSVHYECMKNALVQFELPKPYYAYTIIHIHFTSTGIWLPRDGSINIQWTYTTDKEEWRIAWCDFIRSVYHHELKEQGCTE